MIYITQEEELKTNNPLTALYFYSSWMPLNNKMLTMIDKVEQKYPDLTFLAINTDNFKKLCKRFNIKSIPVVLVRNSGKEINRISGVPLTSAFKAFFNDIYNKEFKNAE